MCWSGEASATLASIGVLSTAYAIYKKEPPVLWIALGYFSLMELLQAFTYSVINRCDLPSNQIATLFGYLHITFQPFFIFYLFAFFCTEARDHIKAIIQPKPDQPSKRFSARTPSLLWCLRAKAMSVGRK